MSEKRLIPCMLDKCRAGEFLSLKDAGLCNIDTQCASTLTARYYNGIGANHDNMVIEVKQIGNLWGEDTDFNNKTSGRVYDKEGISPTLNTMQGGWKQPMIVTMRGRNPENPTSRVAGLPTEQRLEPNLKGVSNTLTSVQKDNLVLEGISTKGKVIDTASTILAGYERTNMTGFNADNGVLEFVNIKQATKDGYIRCKVGGIADLSYPNSKTRRGRVQMEGDLSPTLTATNTDICRIEPQYRIRKLTPKECWRLMGFTDEDFEKAAEVNSNTQLYKQAGNSIVKDVLMAIFKQMLPYEERQIDGISKQVMIDVAVEEDREIMPF